MLRFSNANAKTKELANSSVKNWLANGRKTYSLDLLSGWSCCGADKCLAKVHVIDGKKKLIDGPNQEYRCFSASQEVLYPAVYNQRKHNLDVIRQCKNCVRIAERILSDLPKDIGILRLHVAGDIVSQDYFNAMTIVANIRSNVLFYAYTKSLRFWVNYLKEYGELPENFVLTASKGGRYDDLIDQYKLRHVQVVYSEQEAKDLRLPIDKTDVYAADPKLKNTNFALLIHGQGKAGSKHAKAWTKVKAAGGGYSKKSK
jgi:hypothetical protein